MKASAFDRFKALAAESKDENSATPTSSSLLEAEDAGRRWKRTMRAVFNEDAVVAFQNDLIASYQSEEYRTACKRFERKWPSGSTQTEKLKMIAEWNKEYTVFP